MASRLVCSCGWSMAQQAGDPDGKFLEILKAIHTSTFSDHMCRIEG